MNKKTGAQPRPPNRFLVIADLWMIENFPLFIVGPQFSYNEVVMGTWGNPPVQIPCFPTRSKPESWFSKALHFLAGYSCPMITQHPNSREFPMEISTNLAAP